jgi:RHS repeat-associated protein
MTYDWLSRKLTMSDPDMSNWSYTYDNNGNLQTQTDALNHTITMSYDSLNRLTGKTYPAGLGMTNVTYGYDNTSGGNYGKGKRTGMIDEVSDSSHPVIYKYDNRARLIEEDKPVSVNSIWTTYITSYTYDGADRISTITYPDNGMGREIVTQHHNGRGLPNYLSGTSAGNLVSGASYNNLGSMTQLNLGSGLTTFYGYWGYGGTYDHSGGYYGRLYRIKTGNFQDLEYTWDPAGNLVQRNDVAAGAREDFYYDFLDRLVSPEKTAPIYSPGEANGDGIIDLMDVYYVERVIVLLSPPTPGCDANQDGYINMLDVAIIQFMLIPYYTAYDPLGNITSRLGMAYAYGDKPHAVTSAGSTSYAYDNNGNMTTRGSQTLTWDVENRVVSVTGGASFVYDGDGNRMKKTEGGQTILYINKYYEKSLTTGEITTSYYLGSKLIAQRKGETLSYILQDHLTSTSVMTDSGGNSTGTMTYLPFGLTRSTSGTIPTDKLFTGQRLDSTGLYYYGARYYDASIGRFISPDTIVPNPANLQSLNRYSYCLNNPLKYVDPSGNEVDIAGYNVAYIYADIMAFLATGQMLSQGTIAAMASFEFAAYDSLRTAAPVLANYLESSKDVINIGVSLSINHEAEFIPGNFGNHMLIIHPIVQEYLRRGWLTNEGLTCVIGHEAFHAAVRIGTGYGGKFAANEVLAYAFQSALANELGVEGMDTFSDYNPWMNNIVKNMDEAAYTLKGISNAYTKGWWFWRTQLDSWPSNDPTGEGVLTVAKSVWVK